MSTEIPPAILSGDERSVSEIVSNLRASFRTIDFDSAESALVARETVLRRQIKLREDEKTSIVELLELERLEVASVREELEEKDCEVQELKRRLASSEAETEKWKRRYEAKKAASKRFETVGGNKSSRNAGGDANVAPKQPILIIDSSDDDGDSAQDCILSKRESHPKVPKRKRSSSLNLSTNKKDEDTGDNDLFNSNTHQAQQDSVPKPVSSPITNGAETPSAIPVKNQPLLSRCTEKTSTSAKKSSAADLGKSFWDKFGDINFKTTGNSSSSSSDSNDNCSS